MSWTKTSKLNRLDTRGCIGPWCYYAFREAEARALHPETANVFLLTMMVALVLYELLRKSVLMRKFDYKTDMHSLVLIAVFVIIVVASNGLATWNTSLFWFGLQMFRNILVPLNRQVNFGDLCPALGKCAALPSGVNGALKT